MTQVETPDRAAAKAAAEDLQKLDPGPLAELRRMDNETGAPWFWRLAARHPGTVGRQDKLAEWMEIVRILAILTEKGDPERRSSLHDPKRRLGRALCDGGHENDWPEAPRPMLGERRLAQLMAARGPQRAVLLTRAARMLARSRDPKTGLDVADIARTLLAPDGGRRLAEPYYARLDRAERDAKKSEEGA